MDRFEDLQAFVAVVEAGKLVSELQDADVLVIGVPIYNFGVPAALKAWVDMKPRRNSLSL